MNQVQTLIETVTGIQYRITNNEKLPRTFGTPYTLYQSEIHMIEAIGLGEGIAAPDFAKRLSITRGGVTQTAEKLIRKELIEKFHKERNRKEVFYRLTDMGATAYLTHEKLHADFHEMLTAYLTGLNAHDFEVISNLADLVDRFVPDFSKMEE